MYDVYSLKLASGEEIIGKINFDKFDLDNWQSAKFVTISNPLTLIQTPQGVGAMPWINTGENDVTINIRSTDVVAIVESKSEIQSMYIKATSNIDIASSDTSKLII